MNQNTKDMVQVTRMMCVMHVRVCMSVYMSVCVFKEKQIVFLGLPQYTDHFFIR